MYFIEDKICSSPSLPMEKAYNYGKRRIILQDLKVAIWYKIDILAMRFNQLENSVILYADTYLCILYE